MEQIIADFPLLTDALHGAEISYDAKVALHNFMVRQFNQHVDQSGLKPGSVKFFEAQFTFFMSSVTTLDFLTGRFSSASAKGSNILPQLYVALLRREIVKEIPF